MKKNVLILFLGTIMGSLFATPDWNLYWDKINSFEYNYFKNDFNSLDDGTKEYALYYTGNQNRNLAIEAVKNITRSLESDQLTPKDVAEYNYILAEIYIDLIIDAKSWMDFGGPYETAVENILNYDNNDVRFLLNSAKSMVRFPTPRGTEEYGEQLFSDLVHDNPENPLVIYTDADRKFNLGNFDVAEEGFKKVITLNPNHKMAKDRLESIALNRKNLTIRNITIKNEIKTSKNRVKNKVSSFVGEKLNFDLQNELNREVSKIKPIGGATIKGIQIDDGNVDLELTISENNLRAMAFMVGAPIGLDYSNKIVPGGMGAFLYMDTNFLGTGMSFQLLTAVVFNQLEIKVPGLINDGILDLKISLESMALPTEIKFIEDGKETKDLAKHSSHGAQIGLGRELDFGLISYINYKARFEPQEDLKNTVGKDDSLFHEINGELALNLAGTAMSGLQTLEGLNFSFNPKMVYKPNYKAWGREGNLYTHDDNVSWQFTTQLGLYANLGKSHNVGLNLTHLGSINPYESERFRVGHGATPMDQYGVSGYLPGEILADNAFISNVKYTFVQSPNKLNFYGKYDLLYDKDNNEFYNGAAIGIDAKIPWDIEMSFNTGIGFNADREELPGLVFSLMFMKMHVL